MVVEIPYTLFDGVKSPRGRRIAPRPMHVLFDGMLSHARRAHDGRLWSPATFARDYCSLSTVEYVYAVGVDLDKGTCSADDAARVCAHEAVFVHSTKGHRPEAPRLRAIYPLSRPVSGDEYGACWRTLAKRFADRGYEVDISTKDPSRRWFLPCSPIAGGDAEIRMRLGSPLSADVLIAEAPVVDEPSEPPTPARPSSVPCALRVRRAGAYLSRCPPAVSGQQGHRTTFVTALKLRGFGIDEREALDLLLNEYNPRCMPPWSRRQLRRKVREAFRRGRVVGYGSKLEEGNART